MRKKSTFRERRAEIAEQIQAAARGLASKSFTVSQAWQLANLERNLRRQLGVRVQFTFSDAIDEADDSYAGALGSLRNPARDEPDAA